MSNMPDTNARESEAAALDKVIDYFLAIQREWTHATDLDERLMLALRLNRQLWQVFLSGITAPTSEAPEALKQNLLNLGRLIDEQTLSIITQPTADKLDLLIRINQNVAAGLRGQ